jgi:NaMN:DMB phosphoribosyltransferase
LRKSEVFSFYETSTIGVSNMNNITNNAFANYGVHSKVAEAPVSEIPHRVPVVVVDTYAAIHNASFALYVFEGKFITTSLNIVPRGTDTSPIIFPFISNSRIVLPLGVNGGVQ